MKKLYFPTNCPVCRKLFQPTPVMGGCTKTCSNKCAAVLRLGTPVWNKGMKGKCSKETIEKIRIANLGKHHSEDTKKKMSESHKGNNHLLGHKHSDETRKKMSLSRSGEKHYNWQGGKSFEPYTTDWTLTLKRSIRERDNYTCQLCSNIQADREYCVHHIDYNKKNCNPDNLITLCLSCHFKTNTKRNYWIKYFKKGIKCI